jgi:hypothetical protein
MTPSLVLVSYDTFKERGVSTADRGELRKQWIRRAAELDQKGHFREYSLRQRQEVLRKGFIGPLPPDLAIAAAKSEEAAGRALKMTTYIDKLRDQFDRVGVDEVRSTTAAILAELPPEAYEPPAKLEEPPGHPFRFRSTTLGCWIYFKFQVIGKPNKPQVLFWSCHVPEY